METSALVKPVLNGSKRPIPRSRILSARFTDSEFSAFESLAWSRGTTVSDWAHDALLHHLADQGAAAMEMHLFTELVGIQMLLMNALDPLLRGEKMTQEQLAALYRRVQSTKAVQAQELLARRGHIKEK